MKKSLLTTFALVVVAAGCIFVIGKDMFVKPNESPKVEEQSKEKEEDLAEVTGVIQEVNYVEGKQSITLEGSTGPVIVHIEDKTQMEASVQLEVGKTVKVKHERKMTKSNPPQISAYSVESGELKRPIIEGKIKEYTEEGNKKFIKVESEGKELVFQIDAQTKIGEGVQLEIEQIVVIEHSDVFTLSEPAQGYAEAIY